MASQGGAAPIRIGFPGRSSPFPGRCSQPSPEQPEPAKSLPFSSEEPLIRICLLGRSSPFPASSRLIGFPGRSSQPSPEQRGRDAQGRAGKALALSRERPLIRIGFPGRSSPFPGSGRLSGLASQGGAAPFQGGAASLAQSSRSRESPCPSQGAAAYPDWLPREEQPLCREQPLIRIGFPGRSGPFQGGAASLAQSSRSRESPCPSQGAAAYPDWLPREEQPLCREQPLIRIGFPGRSSPEAANADWLPREQLQA